VISIGVNEVSNWNNSLVPVRLSRSGNVSLAGAESVPKETTVSVGAGVHRARQCADGHGARCQSHGREHVHVRAHVRGCESEPIRACVHGCGDAYENESLS
jgi:hypothetical protein